MKLLLKLMLLSLIITGCGKSITEAEIDKYVAEKASTEEVYDITISPRYSKGEEVVQVITYEKEGELIMVAEEYADAFSYTYRSIFYKEAEPVYITEYAEDFSNNEEWYMERKIYLNYGDYLKGYEKKTATTEDLDVVGFKVKDIDIENYDFDHYADAIEQKGIYEMKFGEFLEYPGQTFLILENKESGYNAAYMILEADQFLNNLYEQQEAYQGKTIVVYPKFQTIAGIERMIYGGGELRD